MTKILSARDLLELAKQEGEARAKDPLVTTVSPNRLVYTGVDDRRRPPIRRPVEQRLPMVERPPARDPDLVKTREFRVPVPPAAPQPPKIPAPPKAPEPPRAPEPPKPPPSAPVAPRAPEPPKPPPSAPEPPRAPAPPKAPEPPRVPAAPMPPAPPVAAAARAPAPPVAPEPPGPPSAPGGAIGAVPLSAPEPLPRKRIATRPILRREEEDEPTPLSEPPTAQRLRAPQAARLDPNFEAEFEAEHRPAPQSTQLQAQPTLLDMEMPSFDDEPPPMSEEPVALSGDETLVLLNYDKTLSVDAVAERTGLTPYLVGIIIDDLQGRGMLEEQDPTAARRRSSRPPKPKTYRLEVDSDASPREDTVRLPTLDELAEDADLAVAVEGARKDARATGDKNASLVEDHATIEMAAPTKEMLAAHQVALPGAPPPSSGPVSTTAKAEAEDDEIIGDEISTGPDDEESGDAMSASANYQRHYELVLAPLAPDMRARMASGGTGPDLFAFAFDKDPAVARALWENPGIQMEHARFAAFHHRTSFGLERMCERGDFARDAQVQRRLIRNPMLSEPLLRRLLMPKRLVDIYKVTLDRDVPEKSRTAARGILRTKFQSADPEDRVQLIWNTEGRVLMNLAGLTIDSKSTSIICGRPITSIMLVQNFCRFAATPPGIIHHCLKQPMIRRQAHLRNLLLKHPNCPSEAKRAY